MADQKQSASSSQAASSATPSIVPATPLATENAKTSEKIFLERWKYDLANRQFSEEAELYEAAALQRGSFPIDELPNAALSFLEEEEFFAAAHAILIAAAYGNRYGEIEGNFIEEIDERDVDNFLPLCILWMATSDSRINGLVNFLLEFPGQEVQQRFINIVNEYLSRGAPTVASYVYGKIITLINQNVDTVAIKVLRIAFAKTYLRVNNIQNTYSFISMVNPNDLSASEAYQFGLRLLDDLNYVAIELRRRRPAAQRREFIFYQRRALELALDYLVSAAKRLPEEEKKAESKEAKSAAIQTSHNINAASAKDKIRIIYRDITGGDLSPDASILFASHGQTVLQNMYRCEFPARGGSEYALDPILREFFQRSVAPAIEQERKANGTRYRDLEDLSREEEAKQKAEADVRAQALEKAVKNRKEEEVKQKASKELKGRESEDQRQAATKLKRETQSPPREVEEVEMHEMPRAVSVP